MVKLTDSQLVLLAAAAQRDDRLLPLGSRLRGAAAHRTVRPLVAAGYVKTHDANHKHPEALLEADGRYSLFRITLQGLAAIGVEPDEADLDPDDLVAGSVAGSTEEATISRDEGSRQSPYSAAKIASTGLSGKALVMAMLSAESGATVAEISAATGWQAHTVRAALSRLRKANCIIEMIKSAEAPTRYRLTDHVLEDRQPTASFGQDSVTNADAVNVELVHA